MWVREPKQKLLSGVCVCVTWSVAAHRELGCDGQVGPVEDVLSRWSSTVVDTVTKTLVGSSKYLCLPSGLQSC